jgi:dTDP-4-amino-4,6-dideoxygalactose transaminase
MAVAHREKLAIKGGPKAVTLPGDDGWQQITQREIDAVMGLVRAGQISIGGGGGVIGELERKFGDWIGVKYCLAQNNGTSTLHSAYFAVGVGFGDEVIVPSYTWHATVTPILHCGGTPIFCEIDPNTLTADPKDIEKKITKRTKAICVVHIWGNPADMEAVMDISNRHEIPVIEDASHAHGAEFDGKKIGSIGHIGCFSLQGSKPLTGGEAGMITTNDVDLFERMVILGHYGRIQNTLVTDNYRAFGDSGLGIKYRAHPLAAGMALVQLERIEELNEKRAAWVEELDRRLGEIPAIEPIRAYPKAKRAGFYSYRARYMVARSTGVSLDRFVEALRAEGVPAGADRYYTLHDKAVFQDLSFDGLGGPWGSPGGDNRRVFKRGSLPQTEAVSEMLFGMPVIAEPAAGLMDQLCHGVAKVIAQLDSLRQ